jgi:tRNA A37 methylthiotransferase MiaB
MNLADSEDLARRLLAAGYVEDSLERADIAILNTCRPPGVRGSRLLQAPRAQGVEDP